MLIVTRRSFFVDELSQSDQTIKREKNFALVKKQHGTVNILSNQLKQLYQYGAKARWCIVFERH